MILARLLRLARPTAGRLAVAWLAGTLALGSAVALTAVSAWLISRAAQHPPVLSLMVAIVAVRAFGIARGVFRYAERLAAHDAAFRVLAGLRVRVYRRLERLAPVRLPGYRRGDLLGRFTADVDTLQDLYLRALLPAGVSLAVAGGAVAAAGWLLPAAGLTLAVALVAAGILVPAATGALARRAERGLVRDRADVTAAVVDLLDGGPDLVAYQAVPARLAALAQAEQQLRVREARSALVAGAGTALSTLALGAAVWVTLVLGIPAVRTGALPGVRLAVLVLLPLACAELVAGLPLAAQYLHRVRQAARRVYDVLDAPDPVRVPDRPAPLPPPPYTLRLAGVRARWAADRPPALNGIDLELPPGRRIAVVGASGAGKTTLAAVLLRFLDPEAGTVTLNGVDLTDLDDDAVRRVVGLCAQDAHVFDTTIAENLRLARPDATESELRDALRAARLLTWVETLPAGLDTPVGEHGARLSGGQRQRLALARALLAGFPVVVFDEPTAHLDEATAEAVTRDLLAATTGRTTVLITHRLAGLEQVDEIVVLDAGRVVQRGTHADLVATPGPYRALWERQHAEALAGGEVTSA